MIPEKIHYCWLSGEEKPPLIKKCMDTWKKFMPDFEFVLWDTNRFDIKSNKFVYKLYQNHLYASAADYVRAYALYTEGGIYLDSDVIVRKSFEPFLNYDFFSAVESYGLCDISVSYPRIYKYRSKPADMVSGIVRCGIQAAVMGAIQGHPLLKDVIDFYEDNQDLLEVNAIRKDETAFEMIAPDLYAALSEKYGFVRKDVEQDLDNNGHLFPSWYFAPNIHFANRNSFAVHCCACSWRKTLEDKSVLKKIKQKLRNIKLLRILLRKPDIAESKDLFDEFQKYEEFRNK